MPSPSNNHISSAANEVFIMPHRFLPESSHSSGFQWNLEEFEMAERPAKITIPGVTYSRGIRPFRN